MADWKQITARIRRARTGKDPAGQLTNLFTKTRDAMVAFELARYLESIGNSADAGRWYEPGCRPGGGQQCERPCARWYGGDLYDPDGYGDADHYRCDQRWYCLRLLYQHDRRLRPGTGADHDQYGSCFPDRPGQPCQ